MDQQVFGPSLDTRTWRIPPPYVVKIEACGLAYRDVLGTDGGRVTIRGPVRVVSIDTIRLRETLEPIVLALSRGEYAAVEQLVTESQLTTRDIAAVVEPLHARITVQWVSQPRKIERIGLEPLRWRVEVDLTDVSGRLVLVATLSDTGIRRYSVAVEDIRRADGS